MSTEAHDGIVDVSPRCWRCRRKLGELLTRPWTVKCTRCKARNVRGAPTLATPEPQG